MIYEKADAPFELFRINLLDADDSTLLKISKERGLALSLYDMKKIQKYFSDVVDRNPYDIELETYGQIQSEHCLHKTFRGTIEHRENGETEKINSLLKTYIMNPTLEMNYPWVLSDFGSNSGIVDFEYDYAIAFKVETHNHPSAIEPFGGAATGVGGVIRDPPGDGSKKPFFVTNVLCFGPLDYPWDKLLEGMKHPRYIYEGVIAGIADYGNKMGIPTVNGAIVFDESYVGNVGVYCGGGALIERSKVAKNLKSGHVAILIGGRTGEDGIHGVTFASEELTKHSEQKSRPAVQVPTPIEEEKVFRVMEQIPKYTSYRTDLGGGGLSCAATEMAKIFGYGVDIHLDSVKLKKSSLAPWRIWVSESQERMLVAAPKENVEKILSICDDENVEAVVVGEFNQTGRVTINYKGKMIGDMHLNFLYEIPPLVRKSEFKFNSHPEPEFPEPGDLNVELHKLLAQPNICSKEYAIRKYDHNVQGATVLNPLQGVFMHEGPGDAAVLKPLNHSWKGVVVSNGIVPNYGKIDPYWMAAAAIDEAIRNNVAVGGRRIALLDNFIWGNPEKPDRLGGLVRACKGCHDFANLFGTPFISGKDSLYNESPLGPITPTLLISAVGVIPDVRDAVSMDLKSAGNDIFIIGATYKELGGSEYYKTKGLIGSSVPKVLTNSKKSMDIVTSAIDNGLVRSCHDISDGGLGVAVAEMAFAGNVGLEIRLSDVPTTAQRDDHILFSESQSRFLVEVDKTKSKEFASLVKSKGIVHSKIGNTKNSGSLVVYGANGDERISSSLKSLRDSWRSYLKVPG